MKLIPLAGILGALGVLAGAFGAHWLSSQLSPSMMEAYRAGVQYHLIHAVALLALGLYAESTGRRVTTAAALMAAGVILFSGSLYALCLTGLRAFAYATPLGGLLLIASWVEIARRSMTKN